MGRLVWIQCRQRGGRRRRGGKCLYHDNAGYSDCLFCLAFGRMDAQGQTERAWILLRRGRWVGGGHSRVRFYYTGRFAGHWYCSRVSTLLLLLQGEGLVWL